ncbi:hypothetical protein YPPY54_3048, partial [Yersinia pestis PY-54]
LNKHYGSVIKHQKISIYLSLFFLSNPTDSSNNI